MFWAIQEQGATILATYADERTQLSFGGIQLQSSWFQSLNPLFVITMAPLFAMLWLKWETSDQQHHVSSHMHCSLRVYHS